jgi:hypothetical protein
MREFARFTDEQGIATFDILPLDSQQETSFWVRFAGFVPQERVAMLPGTSAVEVTAALVRMVSVTGRVMGRDRGPAAGATVMAAGDGYQFGYFRDATRTQRDGTFQLEVGPDQYYSFVAQHGRTASAATNFVVRKGRPVAGVELTLVPATRLHGSVTVGGTAQPLSGSMLRLCQRPAQDFEAQDDVELPNPHESVDYVQPIVERFTRTDESGHFEFYVGPGRYYLVGPASTPIPRITVSDEESLEVNLVARSEDDIDKK